MAEAGRRRRRRRRPRPNSREEEALRAQGYSLIAGLDEVGRGPLAGPVVAGVAMLPERMRGRWVGLVRDSKMMTESEREYVLPKLRAAALALATGVSSSQEIDDLGIVAATRLAMRRALDSLALLPQFLLLDAMTLPDVAIPQKAIVKGDAVCISISAASIAAKVARDEMMRREDEAHPGYGFARHKGYATAEHVGSIDRLGPCPIHRRTFAPVREMVAAS